MDYSIDIVEWILKKRMDGYAVLIPSAHSLDKFLCLTVRLEDGCMSGQFAMIYTSYRYYLKRSVCEVYVSTFYIHSRFPSGFQSLQAQSSFSQPLLHPLHKLGHLHAIS